MEAQALTINRHFGAAQALNFAHHGSVAFFCTYDSEMD